MRHLLSLLDLSTDDIHQVVDTGMRIIAEPQAMATALQGKTVGIFFRRPSTRTRTSFSVGAIKLGAAIVTFGPDDLQLITGESPSDTARVLSEYLNALVIRTNDPVVEMREMATQTAMPIINAMSSEEHPTQAIADLITMHEAFGRLDGLHVLYVGEGNNTAAALAIAMAKTPGMQLTLATPAGYGLSASVAAKVEQEAGRNGNAIREIHSASKLPKEVDVVYTTRWETMGVKHEDPNWRDVFKPFCVTQALFDQVSRSDGGTVFMHDLPAVRGGDVVDEVLDGSHSWAFRQARHKMTGAMAVLLWTIG